MKCESWASLLAHTLASPCFGREPKVRVATLKIAIVELEFLDLNSKLNYCDKKYSTCLEELLSQFLYFH
jgi:hypothetical protein